MGGCCRIEFVVVAIVVLLLCVCPNHGSFVSWKRSKVVLSNNNADRTSPWCWMKKNNEGEEESVASSLLSSGSSSSSSSSRVVRPAFVSTLKNGDEEVRALSIMDAAAELTRASKGGAMLGTVKSLGVDYGLVRTGVAVTVGYNPKPLTILSSVNSTQLCMDILTLVRQERATQIVLGLPLHKNGTVAEQTHLTMDFARNLTRSVYTTFGPSIPVFLWDERYSSKEAQARINANKQQQLHIDADAACIILEHYYADDGLGAKTVQISPQEQAIWDQQWNQTLHQKEQQQLQFQQQRERSLNAKQMAMEKVKRLEQQQKQQLLLTNDNNETSISSKKKNKKKKKKMKKPNSQLLSNNQEKTKKKWITL